MNFHHPSFQAYDRRTWISQNLIHRFGLCIVHKLTGNFMEIRYQKPSLFQLEGKIFNETTCKIQEQHFPTFFHYLLDLFIPRRIMKVFFPINVSNRCFGKKIRTIQRQIISLQHIYTDRGNLSSHYFYTGKIKSCIQTPQNHEIR